MLIQDRLTRHIPQIMDGCADEAGLAMQELIPPKKGVYPLLGILSANVVLQAVQRLDRSDIGP